MAPAGAFTSSPMQIGRFVAVVAFLAFIGFSAVVGLLLYFRAV